MRMVGEDEDRCPERWLVTPPAAPPVVGPLAHVRPELAPAHDLGADALAPHADQGAVERDGVGDPVDPVDDAAVEPPEEPRGTADRLLHRHVLAGGVAVEGNQQVVDSNAGH